MGRSGSSSRLRHHGSLAQFAVENTVVLAVIDWAVDDAHAWGLDAVFQQRQQAFGAFHAVAIGIVGFAPASCGHRIASAKLPTCFALALSQVTRLRGAPIFVVGSLLLDAAGVENSLAM